MIKKITSINKKKKIVKVTPDVISRGVGKSWIYSDAVKDHFYNPQNFLQDDDENKYEFNGVGMVGSPACLAPSTLIISSSGFKAIDSFELNNKVLSHDSKYYPVKKIFRTKYSGENLVKIKNCLGDIVATQDHLIYAKQIPSKISYWHNSYKRKVVSSWVHAGDLRKKDIALYPIPDKIINNIKFIDFVLEKKKWDFKSKLIPEKIKITAGLLEFFGYFIAEGYTKNTEIGFIFSDKEEHLAERVKKLAKDIFDLDARIKIRQENHRIDVNIHNVYLANNFKKLFGTLAQNKQVPEQLMLLDLKLQKGLLRGLWLGDGYFAYWRKQPRAGYTTISPILAKQITFLLLRQRIILSIYQEAAKIVRGVNHKQSYRLHVGDMASLEKLAKIISIAFKHDAKKSQKTNVWIEDGYICLPIKNTEKVVFNGGRLFNFEVAKSHTYATDAFLAHNCGDMMKFWIQVDPKTEKIKLCKWKTFGCASAIASTSMLSVMVMEKGGMKVEKARKLKPQDILARLGGLPSNKIHCSVLGDKALRAAINDYFRKSGQYDRIVTDGSRMVDEKLKITEKDIEQAVIDGAKTLEDLQAMLKIGVEDPSCLPEAEQLLRFYRDKHGL